MVESRRYVVSQPFGCDTGNLKDWRTAFAIYKSIVRNSVIDRGALT